MSKVFAALAASVDGFITGRGPGPGRGLGDGRALFDWYGGGDVPATDYPDFRLSPASARYFDAVSERVGVTVAGRNTYDDSEGFAGAGPHPTAPLVVVSHRPAPRPSDRQTFAGSIEEGIAKGRALAGDKDVALMGGGVLTSALAAGLVDEVIVHQVPLLLGGGRRFFQELPGQIRLNVVEVVAARGVTHLRYEVVR
jgi:dihydrofolate reductase